MAAEFLMCPEPTLRGLPRLLEDRRIKSECIQGAEDGAEVVVYIFSQDINRIGLRATRDPSGSYFLALYRGSWNPFAWTGDKRLHRLICDVPLEKGARVPEAHEM